MRYAGPSKHETPATLGRRRSYAGQGSCNGLLLLADWFSRTSTRSRPGSGTARTSEGLGTPDRARTYNLRLRSYALEATATLERAASEDRPVLDLRLGSQAEHRLHG